MLQRQPADRIKLRDILTRPREREGERRHWSVGREDSIAGVDVVDGGVNDGEGIGGADSPPPSSLLGHGWHQLLTPEADKSFT